MDYCGEDISSIVIDPGSTFTKAGFSGDSSPSVVIPSAVGFSGTTDSFVAENLDQIITNKNIQNLKILHPFNPSENFNAEHSIPLYNHILTHLNVAPETHPLLISEPFDTTENSRKQIALTAFENLGFRSLFLAKSPVLSCFAAGRYSGLVVDVGGSSTRVIPVQDGFVLPSECRRNGLGGDWMDSFLKKRMGRKGIVLVADEAIRRNDSVLDYVERRILRDIRENYCVVMEDSKHLKRIQNKDYKLPDGRLIEINTEDCISPGEAFFSPENPLVKSFEPKLNVDPLPKMLTSCLLDCDADLRKQLVGNIIFSGKGLLLKGFHKRLFAEVSSLLPPALSKLKIILPSDKVRRNFEVSWIGGSILGSLSTFKQLLVTKAEFEESGPSILMSKCP